MNEGPPTHPCRVCGKIRNWAPNVPCFECYTKLLWAPFDAEKEKDNAEQREDPV